MPDQLSLPTWQVIGRSVRGAQHFRRELPNQDALAHWRSACGRQAILAIADGHGGARYVRSGAGASLAVEAAVAVFQEFLEGDEPVSPQAWQRLCHDLLPLRLVRRWRRAVRADLERQPLPETPAEDAGPPLEDPLLAYGTTLLIVAATLTALLVLQIGDGGVLTVDAAGQVTCPLPADPRLLANETTSLCQPHAQRQFRSAVLAEGDSCPALILAATDGYVNSFRDAAGFEQVGRDLLGLLRAEGLQAVDASLEKWLEETSSQGSGDDATLGLVWRSESA